MKTSKYIPEYLRGKSELFGTVVIAALFSILFLVGTIPFSTNSWFRLGRSLYFPFTITFIGVSFFAVAASNFIMYKTRKLVRLTWFWYIIWKLAEIILVASLYTTFAGVLARPDNMGVHMIFLRAFCFAFVCIGVPYIVADMYLIIREQREFIREHDSIDTTLPATDGDQKFAIHDYSGALKLSVSSSNLYYIEADDNYVRIRYEDHKGELKTFMVRSTMRAIEDTFKDSSLVRCHRRFIVNINKVKVLRRERDGYELDLDYDGVPLIPVTKTYAQGVLERFSQL